MGHNFSFISCWGGTAPPGPPPPLSYGLDSELSSFRIQFSFRIEHSIRNKMSIRSWRFHSRMKLRMKSTFIMAIIRTVFKMGSFIHIIKYISAKITKKIRWSVHESETTFSPERDFDLPQSFNLNLNSSLSCKHGQIWNVVRGCYPILDACKHANGYMLNHIGQKYLFPILLIRMK